MFSRMASLLSGALAGQILTFLTLPLVTRLYDPEAFGEFYIALAYCNALGTVAALSMERTLYLAKNERRRDDLTILCYQLVAFTSVVSAAFYSVFASLLENAPTTVVGVPVFIFVGLIIFARGAYLVSFSRTIIAEKFKLASFVIPVKDISRISTRLLLGATSLSGVGLFVSAAIDWIVGFLILVRGTRSLKIKKLSWTRAIALLHKYREFPTYNVPAVVLTVAVTQAPILLIGKFYGLVEAGLFGLAFMLLDRPSIILARAAGDVLTQKMASERLIGRVVQNARDTSGHFKLLVFLEILMLILIAAASYLVVPLVFDARWEGVGHMVVACIPHVLALFVAETSSGLFAVSLRVRSALVRQATALTSMVIVFYALFQWELPLYQCMFVMGVANLIVQSLFLWFFFKSFKP